LTDSVEARFGKLAKGDGFGVFVPAERRFRRKLRISSAEQLVIDQLLYFHTDAYEWGSVGQAALADGLGVSRPTVSGQLRRLRGTGLFAVRPDPKFGRATNTLRYCLEPYLAVLAMLEGNRKADRTVWQDGDTRLLRFAETLYSDKWLWEVDGLRAPFTSIAERLLAFRLRYGISDAFTAQPNIAAAVRRPRSHYAVTSVMVNPVVAKRLTRLATGSDTDPPPAPACRAADLREEKSS
jgi:hypothetical protein